VPERLGANSEVLASEATQNAEVRHSSIFNTEAGISEPRLNETEVAPNVEASSPEGPSSSRFSAAFQVLGRGLLGHPLEAVKNLIPEGFLGNAGTASPERIAQGILISHYQVNFSKQTLSWASSV
jgi:hypothetical protein